MNFPPSVHSLMKECADASRVLGTNPYMTLHGGGNTSVKTNDTLFIKASGFNLGTLTPEGLAPLDRRALDQMLLREDMTDTELVAGYRDARLVPGAAPSIEALLHNYLPQKFVFHSHADAIVTLTNVGNSSVDHVETALGGDILRLPYSMPGFELAQTIRKALLDGAMPRAIVQDHHGLFTFGDDSSSVLSIHEELVRKAAEYVEVNSGVVFEDDTAETIRSMVVCLGALQLGTRTEGSGQLALDQLARELAQVYDGEIHLELRDSKEIREFIGRTDVGEITTRGGATLEHVIRTKRWPMIGADVQGFVDKYQDYFSRQSVRYPGQLTMLDPLPRVALLSGVGLVGIGRTESEAKIAADIYRHTMRIIAAAQALGGYLSVSEEQSFDIEYWELEQAKLK